MKEVFAAFLLLIWIGMGTGFRIMLDDYEKENDCKHDWWLVPAIYTIAPVLIGVKLTVDLYEYEIHSKREAMCIK